MENLLRLKIPGLDAYALKIIAFRWNTLHEHLSPYFRDTPWFIVLRFPADNLQRKQLERTIEQHLASRHPSSLPGPVDLSQGWRERILLPIAAELGFLAMAERNQISLCISRGWFDRPTPRGKLKLRPTADELLPGIAIIRA